MTEGDDGDGARLRARVAGWIADDPDPASRAELTALLDAWPAARDELAERFAAPLTFGTAGLRGPLRAGPNGMNLAVVRQAAAGLVAWLADHADPGAPLVIGFDARHGSRAFAEQTARVATGAGRRALLLPGPLPTPVLAHAVRAVGAAAGVMVTASHNPPRDNGYKVYAADGGQIVPPADAQIEAAIRAVGPLGQVPLGPAGDTVDVLESYLEGALAVLDGGVDRSRLVTAYTPLHGVGAPVLLAAWRRAGLPAPAIVAEQELPDPDFPTVAFPNPEEPGAMDLLLRLAASVNADIAIANDPDADRLAIGVPTSEGWRRLTGDEVGILLADHLMRRGRTGVYATTIVSSSMLRALAAARGVDYAQTLTGFKWIVRAAPEIVYGYEEALGYCVAPGHVRDKDGITAALLMAELAASLTSHGRTLTDRLDELAAELGLYATDQLSVRVTSLAEITAMMATLRAHPPAALLDAPATIEDLAPAADVVTIRSPSARVVVRPSGTEPKLKAYLEVVTPFGDDARARAAAALATLRAQVAATLGA